MPIPGLVAAHHGFVVIIDSSSTTPVNIASYLGVDATGPIFYTLFVSSGAVQGSSSASVPSIDGSTLHSGSVGKWFITGSVKGKGGNGGNGGTSNYPYLSHSGGGGGGAGSAVGLGGTALAPAVAGDPGTATTGGVGGASANAFSGVVIPTSPENGGDATRINHAVTAVVTGELRGGGGGGHWGVWNGYSIPGDTGGDLDQDSSGFAMGGVAGKAVRLVGGAASFSWSGGGVVGSVSA